MPQQSSIKNRKSKKDLVGGGPVTKCEPKELIGDSSVAADIKLLQMDKLQTKFPENQKTSLQIHQTNIAVKNGKTKNKHLALGQQTTPVISRKAAGSNWAGIQQVKQNVAAEGEKSRSDKNVLSKLARRVPEKYIAMDCEMVGVGPNGQEDMLARVSLVSRSGKVLMDKFVKPRKHVTDYRTKISGIRAHDIMDAPEFKAVQNQVKQMLEGKILVGHALSKDFNVLEITHPRNNTRDTAHFSLLRKMMGYRGTPSLKNLAKKILDKEIQIGEHSSVEDARAAMDVYNVLADEWEAHMKKCKRKQRK